MKKLDQLAQFQQRSRAATAANIGIETVSQFTSTAARRNRWHRWLGGGLCASRRNRSCCWTWWVAATWSDALLGIVAAQWCQCNCAWLWQQLLRLHHARLLTAGVTLIGPVEHHGMQNCLSEPLDTLPCAPEVVQAGGYGQDSSAAQEPPVHATGSWHMPVPQHLKAAPKRLQTEKQLLPPRVESRWEMRWCRHFRQHGS